MDKIQKERIVKMENTFNEVSKALTELNIALDQWKETAPLFHKLFGYYTGQEWIDDFEASNKENFPSPAEMPHGVLSEDAISNEFIKHKELAIKMLKLGTSMVDL